MAVDGWQNRFVMVISMKYIIYSYNSNTFILGKLGKLGKLFSKLFHFPFPGHF
jgi:hypothetical protein